MKGLKVLYKYGEEQNVSITDLLKKTEVVNYLEKDRRLTYASQREKLRKQLEKFGDNFKDIVDEYNLGNPVEQQQRQRDTLYGSQRVRAGLDKKDTRGRIVAPRVPKVPKVPKNPILINGEKLTAKQALEKYPQLREFLQSKRKISEKSLQAKYRTFYNEELQKVIKEDDVYEVEKILKSRGKGKNREVFVKWLGYPAKFNSWIPASEVKDI